MAEKTPVFKHKGTYSSKKKEEINLRNPITYIIFNVIFII